MKGVHSRTYDYFQAKLIRRLVERGEVVMAVDRADPRRLFGFACFERLRGTCVLHYLYVRGEARGQGIGSALVRESLLAFTPKANALVWTHRTPGFDSWVGRLAAREEPELPLLYNPFLLDTENHR